MQIRLQEQPFDPGALLSAFSAGRQDTGAVVSFTGRVRGGGSDVRLTLEAYPGFTESEIAKVAKVAVDRFALDDVLVVHRTGSMAAGEAIVFVATAAAHRRAAFEAADMLMDYLKSRAPLWKKETGPDGERWVEPTSEDRARAQRWE